MFLVWLGFGLLLTLQLAWTLPMYFPLHLDTHKHLNVSDRSAKTTDELKKGVFKCAGGVEEDTELQLSDYHNGCI